MRLYLYQGHGRTHLPSRDNRSFQGDKKIGEDTCRPAFALLQRHGAGLQLREQLLQLLQSSLETGGFGGGTGGSGHELGIGLGAEAQF